MKKYDGELWQLMKDNVVKFEADNEEDCYKKLLDIQGQSIFHATTYEGWSVEKMDDEEYQEAMAFAEEAKRSDERDYQQAISI